MIVASQLDTMAFASLDLNLLMGRQMDFLMKISKACWVPVPDDQVDRRDSPYWSERDRQRLNLVESGHNGWAKMRDRSIVIGEDIVPQKYAFFVVISNPASWHSFTLDWKR